MGTSLLQPLTHHFIRQRIIHYIRAGYPGLYLVSPEEQRVEAVLQGIAAELGYKLHHWSAIDGLVDLTGKTVRPVLDPIECLLAIRELPEESLVLLRDFHLWLSPDAKGRFDELFVVDLPTTEERQVIWTLQITRHGRNPRDFEVVQLAKATDGFTGAEIETAFVEAMYSAFERNTEPTDLDIAQVLTTFMPLSKLMAEQITGLRQWAKGRARPATTPPPDSKLRKLAVQ